MRQKQKEPFWFEEMTFVEREAEKPSNSRMAGFKSYCVMQSKFARDDGFFIYADRIEAASER